MIEVILAKKLENSHFIKWSLHVLYICQNVCIEETCITVSLFGFFCEEDI